MKMNYQVALKHMALIAKAIGIFPMLIIVSYVFCGGYDINRLGADLAGLIAVGYLGYGQMKLREKIIQMTKEYTWLAHILVAIGYIMGLVLIILATSIGSIEVGQQLLLIGMSILLYIVFMRGYAQNYSYILSMENLAIITGVYYLAMRQCKIDGLGMMYISVIVAFIFINNQLNIDEILQRTKNNTPMIERIRKDNMKWVFLLMSIILIGYPFRKVLAKGLGYIWREILTCILYIVNVIISLFPTGELVSEGSGQVDQVGFVLGGNRNPLVDIIMWLVIISAIIWLIHETREIILKKLKEVLKRIGVFFRHIFDFLFGRRKSTTMANQDYEDTIEEYNNNVSLKIEKSDGLNKKKWQRKVKKYLRAVGEKSQYREGYKLLLEGVSLRGIEIRKANTPREIMQEIEEKLALQSIKDETVIYEYVRYGEGIAEAEEIVKIKDVLRSLLTINKA